MADNPQGTPPGTPPGGPRREPAGTPERGPTGGAGAGPPAGLSAELARLERQLAELTAEQPEREPDRERLAGRIRVIRHRRDVVARALAERSRAAGEPPAAAERATVATAERPTAAAADRPSTADRPAAAAADRPGRPAAGPVGEAAGGARPGGARGRPGEARRTAPRQLPPVRPAALGDPDGPPRSRPGPHVAPLPETSASSIQTIMLGLGALLLGIASIVFVGVAITELEPGSQVAILLAAAVLFLSAAPAVASRGLTATAETLAAVGLLVFAVAGYPLWNSGAIDGIPGTVYGALVAASTAAVGYGYHYLSRLAVPAWAALLALQPVLPLLAADLVTGPAGWTLVFTLVAAHNVGLSAIARQRLLQLLGLILHGLAVAVAVGCALAGLFLAASLPVAAPAALMLVLATGLGVIGAIGSSRPALIDLAAAVLTLAIITAGSRLVAMALPGRALLPIALIATATTLAGLLLPKPYRRGPQRASIYALAAIGVVVAALALRAGAAAVVWPPWPDHLAGYQRDLAAAVGTTGWQLAVTAAAATVGVGFSLPRSFRREVTAAGAALAALSAPASLGLPPVVGAWLLVLTAAGLAITGLSAEANRGAVCHLAAAGLTGLTGVGVSLASPSLTAAILAALTVLGIFVASLRLPGEPAALVSDWAAGTATVTLPAAAATAGYAGGYATAEVLAATFAAVCASLGYAAIGQLRDRAAPAQVRAGAGLAAFGTAIGALATGAEAIDLGIALLLVAAALAVLAAPRVDAIRHPGRAYDGAELAAAAVTAAVVATLARITALLLPISGSNAGLATAAILVLVVALGTQLLPGPLRRGPHLGIAVVGGLVGVVAAAAALVSAGQTLVVMSPVWHAELTDWPPTGTVAGLTWAAPLALGLLAITGALVLPAPLNHHVSAGLAVLATVGAPVPLGLDWWAPALLSVAVASGYAVAAAGLSARAAAARGLAAATLALYATFASLGRPWLTAAVAGVGVLVGSVTAAAALGRTAPDPRLRVGGTAVTATLLALPGGLGALAVTNGEDRGVALLAALAGTSLGLALLAVLRRPFADYLPYGTVGITAGATGTALATLASPAHPTGVYAAAAVLLAVLAELVRAEERRSRAARIGRAAMPRTTVTPPMGALLAATTPAVLALLAIAPALTAALVTPYQTLGQIWQGPPPALVNTATVPATSVLAALLLTLAAALAAVGFGGAVTRQAVPLVAPGLAVTVLIAPAAFGAPFPVGTVAALAVFTISMLGVALTPPPPPTRDARALRAARLVVLGIGLAAGGAGLAGSLADPQLTWGTFGGAIAVGATAALGGRTRSGRLLGWLGATAAAQAFALTTACLVGATRPQAGFALLAVAAVALLVAARLNRLRRPAAAPELAAIEWLGGYVSLTFAVVLAVGSLADVAAMLIGAGTVLGVAALRPGRAELERRIHWWIAAIAEVVAAWIIMAQFEVGLLEAYTLPFAAFALIVGGLELRYRPELSSWMTYGPGLIAALGPSLLLVITTTSPSPGRQIWVILGGVAALLIGSRLGQRAPLIIGSVVTAVAALHLLSLAGPWLLLIPIGLLLLFLGANREKHQRDLERLRGAYSRMR
ncbi:MAG TPA: permease [Natronosporangium sp.]